MPPFKGFSPGKTPTVAIHAQFFSEVLPIVDDLAEMKVILFCYWALLQKEGEFRYLKRADFAQDSALMQGLGSIGDDPQVVLDGALQRAIDHGVLIVAELVLDSHTERLYFVNTEKGRAAVRQIHAGEWQPSAQDVIILPERPTIYSLYEDHIGALTPHIADELKDAERDYSYEWLVDAVKLAVENNVRRWSYIRAILERWKQEGRVDETDRRSRKESHTYAGLKWSDFAE